MTLPRLAVVNCVAGRDRSPLVEELGAADWQVLELDGARVRDKESLIGALNEQSCWERSGRQPSPRGQEEPP